ncbi:hypothetical protein [Candidatus Spongiisocius sp.]|uniref:hypothetical protein n=1 Tax=Candidatus Spongiisocius sp. TaxID=3101273 RepID=UPI003B59DED3
MPKTHQIQQTERHIRTQLTWSSPQKAANSLLDLIAEDTVGLDILDFCLYLCNKSVGSAQALERILDESGSAWTVGIDLDGRYCLERRVDVTTEKAARAEIAQPGNAAAYLRDAWHYTYGRNPNSSHAFNNAVRAVEAAARPVVTPMDKAATLGKMVSALRDKPGKWETLIGDVETVRKMMEAIWTSQFDRHGTDDTTKPRNVSTAEAEAAVQFAVTIVQIFRNEAISRLSTGSEG